MLNDGTALAARPFDLELGAIAHEIPSQNGNRNRRYKHTQVADTQVHAGLRQGNDLARDGTVAMTVTYRSMTVTMSAATTAAPIPAAALIPSRTNMFTGLTVGSTSARL